MRITILTIGSFGDVLPYVALACGLRDAGYEVGLATSDDFRETARQYGLEFFSLGIDFAKEFEKKRHIYSYTGRNPVRIMRKVRGLIILWRQGLYKNIPSISSLSDAFILHPFVYYRMFWDGMDRQILAGRPYFITGTWPYLSSTQKLPCHRLTSNDLGRVLNRISYYWMDWMDCMVNRLFAPPLISKGDATIQLRRPLSLLKGAGSHSIKFPVILFHGKYMVPPINDSDIQSAVTGYWFLDPPNDYRLPDDLLDFLNAGEPPIYIGFGRFNLNKAEKIKDIVVEALQKVKKRGLIYIAGENTIHPGNLPDFIKAIQFIPFASLFPKVEAVVHHGGFGTTLEAARAGKPTFICYLGPDQRFSGERIFRLGIGPRPLHYTKLTAGRLAQALEIMTSGQKMKKRAQELGCLVKGEKGVLEAVEVIRGSLQCAKERLKWKPHANLKAR